MKEFMEYFPQIIQPFVFGLIFIYVFRLAAMIVPEQDGQTRWLTYYVVGYCIQLVSRYIRETTETNLDWEFYEWFYVATVCMVSAILAFVLGKIFESKWFSNMRRQIRIHDTMRKDFWDDINDSELGMAVHCVFEDGTTIDGGLMYMERGQRYPQISLWAGEINGTECSDNMLVTVDTQKCKYIVTTYNNDSKVLPINVE